MRHLRRRPQYWSPYFSNPDSWEASVRTLLKKLTGAGWRPGQPPPAEWHISYVTGYPEWTAIWLVATALSTTPEELLQRIRPGRRRIRDVDELNILYEFIKEYLVKNGKIRGKDVAGLAGQLGLATLSGPEIDKAKERTYLLKQLVRDGYAIQHMGRFRGSSYYVATEKLLAETATRPATPSIEHEIIAPAEEMPVSLYAEEPVEPTTPESVSPATPITAPAAPLPPPTESPLPSRRIVIIGGQKGSCPDGSTSLRAIKQKECAWLDKNFRWSVLSSYRNDNFSQQHLPKEADLVIIFSKYMNHSQVNMAVDFYTKRGIPFINNIRGNPLGSLQMAAEAAKTHGPAWFAEAYAGYMRSRRKKPTRMRRWGR